jgi:hypothetical protein
MKHVRKRLNNEQTPSHACSRYFSCCFYFLVVLFSVLTLLSYTPTWIIFSFFIEIERHGKQRHIAD